jgi:hypothetical protein
MDAFTARDFERYPIWRVSSGDSLETRSRFEITDTTYSPWTEPVTKDILWPRSKFLVSGRFQFADGSEYPGYFQLVGTNWDDPLPPRRMRDGTYAKPLQWSARRGGGELSVLSLLSPEIFVKGSALDFHFHPVLPFRETHVRVFYSHTGKTPAETFPVHFETQHGIDGAVNSGVIPGFYRFPLGKPYEVNTGEDIWLKFAKR